MNVKTYLRAIRKRWWLVLAVTVLGAVVGVAAVVVATPVFVSTVTFYVATTASADSSSGSAAYTSDEFAQRRANSYAELLSKDRVAQAVIDEGNLDLSVNQLAGHISGAVDLNTVLLTATVQDSNADRALQISTALAAAFPPLVQDLDAAVSTDTTVRLSVVSGPTVPGNPVSPKPVLDIGLGVLVGLVIGLFAAAARERLDTAVRSAESLTEVSPDHPILTIVPVDGTASTSPLVWGSRARSARAEAYRRLRTNLRFADVDNPVRTIVVTSSLPDEGKSSTSANLALSFADSGLNTVVVEADLRRPKLAQYFDFDRTIGLTDILAGERPLSHVLQSFGGGIPLSVLPAGELPPNPSELLGSNNMNLLLDHLRQEFDVVILDTPPVLPVTDAAVLAAHSDGVVFVVRYGQTKRAQVAQSLDSLRTVDARVLGFVLNMTPDRRLRKYEYTYEAAAYTADPSEVKRDVVDPTLDLTAAGPRSRVRRRVVVEDEGERTGADRS